MLSTGQVGRELVAGCVWKIRENFVKLLGASGEQQDPQVQLPVSSSGGSLPPLVLTE